MNYIFRVILFRNERNAKLTLKLKNYKKQKRKAEFRQKITQCK